MKAKLQLTALLQIFLRIKRINETLFFLGRLIFLSRTSQEQAVSYILSSKHPAK